ncbi:hypothetical protein GV829_14210 [Sphingomonas lacunae]|uniref:PilZ domain-containing protein n=1 Tax=Sphingomonas lacunae TaxID=2698828 RepID=A0A6M4AYJ4_9SPHN|nr:PilZ domain-containing protein [Sphingomonas lacunae]QJQ33442.1 hypothetical protein GV829_14210 [Sphingomonas lacunae]
MKIRNSVRTKCLHGVQLYVAGRGYTQVVVKNYSSFGLCIRSEFEAYVGEVLTVRFPNGELRRGVVRWIGSGKFGMETDMPLSMFDFSPRQESGDLTWRLAPAVGC